MVISISGEWGRKPKLRQQNPLKTKSAKAVPLSAQTARHMIGRHKVWRIIIIITRSWALLVIPCAF
jgi:hypothetical protein